MTLKEGDFIEIEFTGMLKTGEIFDSNIKKDLEKTDLKLDAKPFIFCLGKEMFLKGVEELLYRKEIGEYRFELPPERAFGFRDKKLVKLMPIQVFKEHNSAPVPGAVFRFDNYLGKVISVSGGRVIVDFNNPLAGKTVIYQLRVIREVKEDSEKIKALTEFFFKRDFDFELKDRKITLYVEHNLVKLVELFKDKFRDILSMELEVKEVVQANPESKDLKQPQKVLDTKENNNSYKQ